MSLEAEYEVHPLLLQVSQDLRHAWRPDETFEEDAD
jgi:hypothetical protein